MDHARALPAAVLWDMDGTLVDTEPYWIAEEHLLVEAAGGTWSHEDALALVGNDLLTSARTILARTPVTGTPEEVVETLLGGVVRRCREEVPWRPGALELLAGLVAAGVPCALVTMSWQRLVDVVLARLPDGSFSTVVSGDQVTHGKPHPEPYLTAARRLRVEPQDCVALEDSATGIASATAAGVPTLGIPAAAHLPEDTGAVLLRTLAGVGAHDLLPLAVGAPA